MSALRDSRAGNTRAQYRSAWRGWSEWAALVFGHQAVVLADPLTIAAYLAERVDQGAAAATVRTIRAAIRAGHVDTGADDPTGHDGVRPRSCRASPAKQRAGAAARPIRSPADDVAASPRNGQHPQCAPGAAWNRLAAAVRPGRHRSGDCRTGGLFQGGLRLLSEAAALRWADVQDAADGRWQSWSTYRRSKTVIRTAHIAQVLGGINGQSIARRLTAAASGRSAKSEGRNHRALRTLSALPSN